MHRSVIEAYISYTSPLEGVFRWFYQDVKHFITTGIGNLADPVSLALAFPWKLPNGDLASRAQVIAEWESFKAQPKMAQYPASSPVVQNATTIRLTDDDVLTIVRAKLLSNEQEMRKFYPGWDNFPADAQLALSSLAWAMGPDYEREFTNLMNSANRGDWMSCAVECKMRETGNAGIVPRNAQNVLLFHNAAAVAKHKLDPETLFWPHAAPDVDADVHQVAVEARSAAPYDVWDRTVGELYAGLDLTHGASDYEIYNGDGTVSS